MLKIQFRDGRSEAVALVAPGKTIGKGAVNDIVIDQDGVNGFHADLQVDGDRVILTDVNTQNGTFLNGEKITGPMDLKAGDILTIDGVELEISEQEESAARTLVLSGAALAELGGGHWLLIADSGPEKGQRIPIQDGMEIGRALECDISILEPSLSRKHAELSVIGDEAILRDLGSVNGTYVNGKKIDEVSLRDRDVIQFNKIRFIVSAPD
ncbi:MAG: FHA domain-containing protein [Pseudomonadales bacterium]|nr:FHA domain-containing protein [Pseudomonadales bacterium]